MPDDEADHVTSSDRRQSQAAAEIARGVTRMMTGLGFACVPELTLASGLRADIAGLHRDGRIAIVEIKSSLADFRADHKWQGYLEFCDAFWFAVNAEFPVDVLPPEQGLIIADKFGAAIIRESAALPRLGAARRKAVTLRIARSAALRLSAAQDPGLKIALEDAPD